MESTKDKTQEETKDHNNKDVVEGNTGELDDSDEVEVEEKVIVEEIIQKKKKVSVFVSQDKTWDDEDMKIPENIKKGLLEELKWDRPSKIQKNAIPSIAFPDDETGEYDNLIAQAKNGAGKSGAFVIGSLMRVDPTIKQAQVIVVGHTRELVNQLTTVFERATRFAPEYSICNLAQNKLDHKAQIIVSTFGQVFQCMSGRQPLNLNQLRVFVLDEADTFFLDNKHKAELDSFVGTLNKLKNKVQFVFFSATYEHQVGIELSKIIKDAIQITMKKESLRLENVQQFYHKCKRHGKLDYIMEIFDSFKDNTQTIIFVNTINFAETVYDRLNKEGYRCFVMFSRLTKEERDDCIKKFREGSINVIIATNLLSRGFDMHTIKLVINFDVPSQKHLPDYESYLHRVGRSGRFGNSGVALTLFDREDDEKNFFEIIAHYNMKSKVQELDGGAKQLTDVINQAKEDDIL